MSLTELSACSFDLERHVQRPLVVLSTLLEGIAETLADQAEIDAGKLRLPDWVIRA
jgi:hypothetical protein